MSPGSQYLDVLGTEDGLLHTGDVILTRARKLSSWINMSVQQILRLNRIGTRWYSHVAIYDGVGTIVHAEKGAGVHGDLLIDLLESPVVVSWCVYRYIPVLEQLKVNGDFRAEFSRLIRYYAGQDYGLGGYPGKSQLASAAYCSELAARVFREVGFEFSRSMESRTLPIDVCYDVRQSDAWIDVTGLYRHRLEDPTLRSMWSLAERDGSGPESLNAAEERQTAILLETQRLNEMMRQYPLVMSPKAEEIQQPRDLNWEVKNGQFIEGFRKEYGHIGRRDQGR